MAGRQGAFLTRLDGDSPGAYDSAMKMRRQSRQSPGLRVRLGLAGLGAILLILLMMALLSKPEGGAAHIGDEPLAQLGMAPGASRTDAAPEPRP